MFNEKIDKTNLKKLDLNTNANKQNWFIHKYMLRMIWQITFCVYQHC